MKDLHLLMGALGVGLAWVPPAVVPDHYLIYRVSGDPRGFTALGPAAAYAIVYAPATAWSDPDPIAGPGERYYLMRSANAGDVEVTEGDSIEHLGRSLRVGTGGCRQVGVAVLDDTAFKLFHRPSGRFGGSGHDLGGGQPGRQVGTEQECLGQMQLSDLGFRHYLIHARQLFGSVGEPARSRGSRVQNGGDSNQGEAQDECTKKSSPRWESEGGRRCHMCAYRQNGPRKGGAI